MFKKPDKPKKDYNSFMDFYNKEIHSWRFSGKNLTDNIYPCLNCNGCGIIYDPDDPPCIIEGNKLRNRIKCTRCLGSKIGYIDEWKRLYKIRVDYYNNNYKKYKQDNVIYNSILLKLNKEELYYLNSH